MTSTSGYVAAKDERFMKENPNQIPLRDRLPQTCSTTTWLDTEGVSHQRYIIRPDTPGWKMVDTFNGVESDTHIRYYETPEKVAEWMRTHPPI
jgi:hypothetical protein